ncbi:tripartite tricarboxylate transporter substrate binding protein (plasmid) [Agrobacterium salinitolerans]|uniref:Bug family tripartite tricarboxylate transporter substrate binding protein n=1 Tax=Agrobacterium salinitolerans TaxID=1183413 RepID=UPI000DD08FEB|nr:tripartite tricarboxylate transporter substrate binding protein [Agrobacterium salinitolerans]QXC52324.1 tripartite tricarboxylate transporter substrate binding protein [Agrobacterium salinitolerans]
MRRLLLLLSVFCTLPLATAAPALADDYPSDTVTILVPFPPGGTTDLTARMLAEFMAKKFGKPFVVENRPGAGGNIGTALVARAKPDGYTLTISGVGTHAANFGLYPDMPYDALKDFTHITDIARGPNAIAVNGETPIKDLNDLIARAKAEPGSLNYASPGNGSSGHLAFEFLKQKASVSINHIPYKGAAPAVTDVMGGHVPILIVNADTLLPHVKSGALRLLAVTSPERSALYPEVPTVSELGFEGFSAISWTGLSAPAGLPEDIEEKLRNATLEALNSPKIKARFQENGNTAGGLSSVDFTAFVSQELDKWTNVAKTANIKIE